VPRLIVDIETAGRDFDTLDEASQAYFLRYAKTEEEITEARDSLSFYPLTAEVIAIGLLDPDTDKGSMYFQTPGVDPLLPFEEEGITYETGTEEEILRKFWQAMKTCECLVTFNGRGFDCPFILVRSAMHRLKPTRDLMPNRYGDAHIDLMDRLSFFGSTRRRFSLDMWCRAFGITSPKEDFTGYEVKDLFRSGRHLDIARYCVRDIRATKELFSYWESYIRWPSPPRR
jgi:DNA polymerase III epsilon subunit-like protein